MPRTSSDNDALPQCEGPKLQPFKDRKATIRFHRVLGGEESESGAHAHVFEISVGRKHYALKVFKFYDSSEEEAYLDDEERNQIPVSLIRAHMDPFYNECRAYGKLVETGLNGKIAVYCYGYLTLPASTEAQIRREFNIVSWDRAEEDFDRLPAQREPLRAIVKEFIKDDLPFSAKDVKKMLQHLKRLRRLNVHPMDMKAQNYRAGLLVDFSAAMTKPHYLFKILPPWRVKEMQDEDLNEFQDMIDEANVNTWVRAVPNKEYLQKLRRRR